MTKRFCDRCGKEIADGNVYILSNKEFYRRILTFRDASDEYYSTDHEICEECQTALYKWWSEGKKEEI